MKYCVECGASNADSSKFCTECGAKLVNTTDLHTTSDSIVYGETSTADSSMETVNDSSAEVFTYSVSENVKNTEKEEDKYTYTYNANNTSHTSYSTIRPGIAPRNIVVAIILSIVTCGIYQLYWMFKMNEEVNELSGNQLATSGGLVIVFHLVTCGIYGIYWSYRMGERCDEIKGSVGGNSAILYLILTLLGFGIVTYCLIQDTINRAV